MAQGDVLDLRDLLQGEENASDLGQYLTFTQSGTNTVIGVSHDGSGHVTQEITLNNVDLTTLGSTNEEIIQAMLNNGSLKIDQ